MSQMMKRTYSVGSCPIGEQLGHSTRVTTFEEGNKHGHPAGSAFCLGCRQVYPAVSAQPAVAATLRTLARAFNNVPRGSESEDEGESKPCYYFQSEQLTTALVRVFPSNLYDLDTYISPSSDSKPDFFAGKPINPRLLPIAQELLKIGFLVLDLSSTNRQNLNQLVLGRPRRLAQEDNEEPIAIEVSLQAI